MISSIFVNLPIADLSRSVEFFTGLGFEFNPQFTSEDTTCMIIGPNMFAMLMERARFESFVDKPIADSGSSEVLIALMCDTAAEVSVMAEKAFALGGRRYKESEDHGFMFSWGFEDLDGHIWELGWMDPNFVE
jgi:predicted lactoylglutathione lyase